MGRFSWLSSHLQHHKHKKSPQHSFEEMIKKLQLGSPNHASTNSRLPEALVGGNDASSLGNDTKHVTLSPRNLRSGEYDAESNMDSVQSAMGNLRRSFSVGCDLDQQRRIFDDDKTDDCIDQMSSFEGSHDANDIVDLSPPYVSKSAEPASPHQDQESLQSPSPRCSSDLVDHESIFSSPNAKYLDKEGYKDCHEEYADGHDRKTSETSRMSKSYSMPNFGGTSPTSPQNTSSALIPRNRSSEDLNIHSIKEEDIPSHDAPAIDTIELNNNDSFCPSEKFDGENAAFDNYASLDYGHSSKEWIVPDDVGIRKHRPEDSSSNHWSHFPGQDLKFKRIEDWVNDIQHCSPVEETNETASSSNQVDRGSAFLDCLNKVETKLNPGMEAAKRCISSLNATATSVQLANHGLVAIPLLGGFGSLKVLNLSGNSIVRITVGALPRGLHMLNLSENKISTIEGLRELTRLRVLDLSYNKISRIGHGLASCSSVKELYLAGNKISEVEGLHRLLKLAVVDLRFNKIATSKSLGQLAANYNSLQAISLEGNPAQKNVGDDQLKKYLQSLLPNLAYYNRKHTKTSTLKDSSDRAVRLGISDHKSSARRSVTKRASHSSVHGQKSHASDSIKQAKGKHGLVPPSSSRVTRHHDLVKSGPSLQKSRSEGTLAQN